MNIIQKNWPTKGVMPHRHGFCGSIKPSTADTTQITGRPAEKYHDESQASLLPEIAEIAVHARTPVTMESTYNQDTLLMANLS